MKVSPGLRFCAELQALDRTLSTIQDKLLELSKELPIIIEVVAAQEKIDMVMPKIDDMMTGGIITIEPVRVVRYCNYRGGGGTRRK